MSERVSNGVISVALIGFVVLAAYMFITPPISQIYSDHENLISEPTPEPPAFDLGAVRARFVTECEAPVVVDGLFCEQVEFHGMRGEGHSLHVPTTLRGKDYDRAVAICNQVAIAHFDGHGRDLGYVSITVGSRIAGRNVWQGRHVACTIKDQ